MSEDLTDLESLVRQCTIYIVEVYDATGNQVVGMRAFAEEDDEELCSVTSAERVRTPAQLGELLKELGLRIGDEE